MDIMTLDLTARKHLKKATATLKQKIAETTDAIKAKRAELKEELNTIGTNK